MLCGWLRLLAAMRATWGTWAATAAWATTSISAAACGVRPLVSLKSSVKLEKQPDGSYKIVDSNNTGAVDTTSTWKTSHTELITITDERSGLAEGAEIQYGWSTSKDVEPSTWTTTQITGYTAGANTASIEVTESEITGEYYLWVKPVQVKDTSVEGGNSQTETEISENKYLFDNTLPTISVTQSSQKSLTITTADMGSGLTSTTGRYYLSMSSTELTGGSWKEYTSATANAINDLTGAYYLFVEKISDNAGNLSEQNGTLTTIDTTEYHMFGPYTFDNTAPTIEITPTGNQAWSKENVVTVTIADELLLGIDKEFSYKYAWTTSNTIEPSTWTDVTIPGKEYTSNETATTEIVGSGLTGKYYLWIRPVSIIDDAGNVTDTTDIVSEEFWFDNTAPAIKIGNELSIEDYGGYVTNYTPTNGVNDEGIKWRIFYSDASNVYLIADTYVPVAGYVPTGYDKANGTHGFNLGGYKNYNGTSDIDSEIASKWLKQYTDAGYTATNKELNGKSTAYLLDTNAWAGFKDSYYADYAVGGPTLELFVASYNKTHITKPIETQIQPNGYYFINQKTQDGIHYISGPNIDEDLYVLKDTHNMEIDGVWIASPSNDSRSVFRIKHTGEIWFTGGGSLNATVGARPIVCLNSHYQVEKQQDGTYKIVEKEEPQWAKSHTETITITDEHSGLAQGAELEYGWSANGSEEPTSWNTTILTGYETGAKTATVTINNSELTGKYHLWVRPTNLKDTSAQDGNAQIGKSITANQYWFDNTTPTISVNQTYKDMTITLADEGSGLAQETGRYYLSTSNQELVNGSWENYGNGAKNAIENLTGTYYLFVERVSDNVGNLSETNGTLTTIGGTQYNMFGPYVFDNTLPTIQINPTFNTTWSKEHSAIVTIADETGLVRETDFAFKYAWSTSNTTEPGTWTNVRIPGENYPPQSKTATVTGSGFTGKYYLWVKPVLVKDMAGNEITSAIVSEEFYFDNEAPKVIIGDQISAETLTADNYGGYVTNYTPTNGVNSTGTQWRIFHSDGDNIYLIADSYVPVAGYVPTGYINTSGTYGFDLYGYSMGYKGTADIDSKIANKWLSQYISAGDNKSVSANATAYLLDTTAWAGFKDSKYADYAVGAPTLELFAASYNATHPTKTIETQVNSNGYDVAWSNGSYGEFLINGLETSKSLYAISKTFDDTVYGMWLASPSALDAEKMLRAVYTASIIYGNYDLDHVRSSTNNLFKLRCSTRKSIRR